jgi:hypothetical protein
MANKISSGEYDCTKGCILISNNLLLTDPDREDGGRVVCLGPTMVPGKVWVTGVGLRGDVGWDTLRGMPSVGECPVARVDFNKQR